MSRRHPRLEILPGGLRSTRPAAATPHRAGAASNAALFEPNLDFEPAELLEFLEADVAPVAADPIFKERLRRRLWLLITTQLLPAWHSRG